MYTLSSGVQNKHRDMYVVVTFEASDDKVASDFNTASDNKTSGYKTTSNDKTTSDDKPIVRPAS